MWFGDLVTMQWWNDLWLNESFAEWASHHLPGRGHRVAERAGRRSAPPRRPGPTARTSSPRPTRSSPTSATSRTSRSTSTASPTPRARRCSSSSSPTSAGSRSSRALRALLQASTRGATPTLADLLGELETTSRPRPGRRGSQAVAGDGRRQHAAPRRRGRRPTGVITSRPRSTQTAPRSYPTLRAAPARRRPATTVQGDGTLVRTEPRRARRRRRAHRRARAGRPAAARTCCWSTTTTSPTPRSASTSARSRRPSRTSRGFADSCRARWSSARRGT